MKWLNRDEVERQIAEAYASLNGDPWDEAWAEAYRDVTRSADEMHAKLNEQERLFEAGPELLEACKAAQRLLDRSGEAKYNPEYQQLQAAIAKAEGYQL